MITHLVAWNNTNLSSRILIVQNSEMGMRHGVDRAAFLPRGYWENLLTQTPTGCPHSSILYPSFSWNLAGCPSLILVLSSVFLWSQTGKFLLFTYSPLWTDWTNPQGGYFPQMKYPTSWCLQSPFCHVRWHYQALGTRLWISLGVIVLPVPILYLLEVSKNLGTCWQMHWAQSSSCRENLHGRTNSEMISQCSMTNLSV